MDMVWHAKTKMCGDFVVGGQREHTLTPCNKAVPLSWYQMILGMYNVSEIHAPVIIVSYKIFINQKGRRTTSAGGCTSSDFFGMG